VYVELEAKDLDRDGFVLDYGVIKDVIMKYDHQDLNEMLDFFPTAEQLAKFFWVEIVERHHTARNVIVLVKETDDSFAEYRE
jgi:6-pyruvoyl-tetrahydropterin synthase